MFVLFMVFSFGSIAEAKSFSIDSVHIKSWIQPNGDLLVNEVFTYDFEGDYDTLSRSFPNSHKDQVVNFYAYELTELNPEPGFIPENNLNQLKVSHVDGMYRTNIKKKDTTTSFLYVYTLKNAVQAYESYSELKVTFFENVEEHDVDLQNVTIDFILPEPIDSSNFDGVLIDRHAKKLEKSNYGIRFRASKSEAYTETKTSFFFPSTMMTNMEHQKDPISMEEALANEKALQQKLVKRLSNAEQLVSIIPYVAVGLIILVALLLLLPQRHFWRKGSQEEVLTTDIVYLYFVARAGKPHPKAFLVGLFSLVEKGAAKVRVAKAAIRFKNDPKAPKETLDFRLDKGSLATAEFEKQMVDWLFTSKSGSSKWTFHLHDAAGASRQHKKSTYFHRKVKEFKRKQTKWHRTVEKELEEAGAFNSKLPLIILSAASIFVSFILSFAYLTDVQSGWSFAIILLITVLFIVIIWRKKRSTLFFSIYIILLFFFTTSLVHDELINRIMFLLLMLVLLYIVLPRNILSMSAVRAKDAVRSFRKNMKYGYPAKLSLEQQEKWIIRAYLLGRNKEKLPLEEVSIPIAALLFASTDPLDYVTQSWRWTKDVGSSSDGSSSGSFDSGGGDGGGGGGAGAD